MDIVKLLPTLYQKICEGLGAMGSWWTSPLVTINGFQIVPIYLILPSALLVILGVCTAKFILDW